MFFNQEDFKKFSKAMKNQDEDVESISYDNKNNLVILKFKISTIKIPFANVKEFYKNIIKMEEIGMVKSDNE